MIGLVQSELWISGYNFESVASRDLGWMSICIISTPPKCEYIDIIERKTWDALVKPIREHI